MMALAAIPLTLTAVLCFVAGMRYPYGKWRRLIALAIGTFVLGSFMMVATGYFWGYQEVRDYYERIFKELIRPHRPTRPPVDKNVLEA